MNQIVSLLSRWLIKHNAIAPSDRELYEYALYSFLLSLTPLIIFLVISGVIGMFWEGMLIVFPFMVLRKFAGGFHAKHAFVCLIVSTGLLALCLYVVAHISNKCFFDGLVAVAVINIIIHSPIDSENRRLSETEKEQYSWMTRFLVIVIMMFYVILIIVRLRYYASCVAISLCLSALLQLPCVLRLKWQKD
ncbi:MAG: accessory gene regulator ArgB-like protein [Eubacterium sp.]|jgi:hypothetical protein|nr:MAG: hypothetical protein DBY03_02700 [Clostridiales bacterium]